MLIFQMNDINLDRLVLKTTNKNGLTSFILLSLSTTKKIVGQ